MGVHGFVLQILGQYHEPGSPNSDGRKENCLPHALLMVS